jgi:PAS domain S-box-containing protein
MDQQPPAPTATDARPARLRRRGLAALVAAALLVPGAIVAAGAWIAWRAAWTEADRELAVAAEAAGEFAQRVIEGHARLAARVAESLEDADDEAVRADEALLNERLARFVADLPLVVDALVLGADGAVLARAAASPMAMAEGYGRAFVAALEARDAPAFRVSPAPRDPGLTTPAFAISLRRIGAAGGVVILLHANRMGARMSRLLEGADNSAALVATDGRILARHPPSTLEPPPLGPDRPLIAALAAGRDRGTLRGETPRDGRAVLVAFRRLDGLATLAVAVARPESSVVARWRAMLLPLLAVGLPATLALGALALVVRRQQRRLEAALTGLEHRVAERTASLREGEERLRLAVGAGRFGTWETELATGITSRSARTIEILGFPADQTASPVEDWGARIHPDDRGRVLAAWDQVATGRLPGYRLEYRFLRPDGTWRWLESTAAVVRADPAGGAPLRLAGTLRDITERRAAEERRELLTREVNHRARNTLAIVQAILRLTRAPDAETFARLVEGRIAALGRAQSLLAAERWTGAPLATLVRDELTPFGGTEEATEAGVARLTLDGPALRLRAEAVQPLGMVFHELGTNAAKHGALSTPAGRVAVSWQVDEAKALLRIHWAETGGPPPGFPQQRGVGSRVIEATVGGQLGGSVERRWPAEGLSCDIVLPLARVRAGPA